MSKNKTALCHLCCLLMLITAVVLTSCNPVKKSLRKLDQRPAFTNAFSGLVLLDPETDKILLNHQGAKYFTPASNTKLFTFYAANLLLGDSIPAFEYHVDGDSIWLKGTGDPSFLHPDLPTSKVFDFLTGKYVFLVRDNFDEPSYGPGWAWDDYSDNYQRAKSTFPIYGNAIQISWDSLDQQPRIMPRLLNDSVFFQGDDRERAPGQNQFFIEQDWDKKDTINIPLLTTDNLIRQLWSDTLNSTVNWVDSMGPVDSEVHYSIPTDSVFKVMLQVSDNFLAEQLILLCSWKLSGELNSKKTIERLTDSLLADLPQKPIWVDGSGLSRYNLFTPHSVAVLLDWIYHQVGMERVFDLFPAGGKSGTIEDYYAAEPPYIYAKTGTLRNNHALSGYLITKQGKILVFSFMHNHYPSGSHPIKVEMEKLLWKVHLKY